LAVEAGAQAGQQDSIYRAPKPFGVTRAERDCLIEDNKLAESTRAAHYRGNI
jgi:hypothetical protein